MKLSKTLHVRHTPHLRKLSPVSALTPRLRQQLRLPNVQSPDVEGLDVTIRANDTAATVSVRGEVDMVTAPALSEQLTDVLRAERGDVLVDLNDTAFLDSTGLHVLLNAQRRLVRQGHHLFVICENGPVRRVIELARLDETLGLISSEREYRRRMRD
jgi:anti-sigma B factor antagonist